jgi:serine/threonine protein kinase
MQKELTAIKHEISMLRALNHPNIVKYYGTEISEDL